MLPVIALVGRPNVGKSTLFNRLTRSRDAIVADFPGLTRDRQYGKVEWTGKEFSLIDTGGWVVNSEDVFEEEINKQVKVAIEEADVILFVVDVLNGITDLDMEVAQILRRCKRPVIVVANKADNYDLHPASAEFYSFGLGDPFCISAINGSYTGDLLDKIVATLPEEKVENFGNQVPMKRPGQPADRPQRTHRHRDQRHPRGLRALGGRGQQRCHILRRPGHHCDLRDVCPHRGHRVQSIPDLLDARCADEVVV